MAGILVSNSDTRRIAKILNLKEIRSGRMNITLSPASISYFKNGKIKKLQEKNIVEFKREINSMYLNIMEVAKKNVEADSDYLFEILDLADLKPLNWREVIKNVNAVYKPKYQYLQWSYYHSHKPNPNLIKKHEPFFEQLKFELILIASKIKI